MKFNKLNKAVAGTGFQFFEEENPVRENRIRVENESGETLRHFSTINSALKVLIPLGCGRKPLVDLQELAK